MIDYVGIYHESAFSGVLILELEPHADFVIVVDYYSADEKIKYSRKSKCTLRSTISEKYYFQHAHKRYYIEEFLRKDCF